MKAHEIIKELRLLAPNGILKLLTISESIKELRDYVHESKNSKGAWQLIDLIEQLSGCVVTLSQFVICDANGVPLEKPIHIGHGIAEQAEADAWRVYNEAQKSVIFEGWEVLRHYPNYIYILNKDSDIELEFSTQDGIVEAHLDQSTLCNLYGEIKSLADLAAATTKNPLKLK